jgi:hypothetical protein
MPAEIEAWAWQQRAGGPLPRLLLLTIAGDTDGDAVHIGNEDRLAAACEMRPGRVGLHIDRLSARGLLGVLHRLGEGAEQRHVLLLACPLRDPGTKFRLGHTGREWAALVAACGSRCVGCGDASGRLTKDHIIPRSRGGIDSLENLQPLCGPCNSRKGVTPGRDLRPEGWRAFPGLGIGVQA